MAEGFVGAKIVGVILAIVGVLLLAVGATQILAISIPGLPTEIVDALLSTGINAYITIVNGLIALGVSIGLFRAQEWAAGGAAVLLLIIAVNAGFSFVSNYIISGTLGDLYSELLALSIPAFINIGVLVVSLICLVYLVAASGWR